MNELLIIARHGNTFRPGETPTRVGGRTDLPLVEERRARAAGRYLLSRGIRPDRVHAAPLARTMQTAALIVEEGGWGLPVVADPRFTEIDHGPDENKTEEEVKRRLGEAVARAAGEPLLPPVERLLALGAGCLAAWDARGEVPPGWRVDVEGVTRAWKTLAGEIPPGGSLLLCTSNGVIRFAPCLLAGGYETFGREHALKVATGSLSFFRRGATGWHLVAWNVQPSRVEGDPAFTGLPWIEGGGA
jgi:probable phosphoglycerate mutase